MTQQPKITAKRLILGLLLAARGRELSAARIVAAAALFGMSDNNVRVSLTRLSAEGRIESAGRGTYRLGPAARAVSEDVGSWRRLEGRVRDWAGDFAVAHTGSLGRRDRQLLRRRERALEMLGFRELERGLHVRPNNLERDVDAIRERLFGLGLERESVVFAACEFDAAVRRRIDTLWNARQLDAHYVEEREHLQHWMDRANELEPDVAARESYLIGDRAIRSIVFDPWLPAPFVDVDARHAFFDVVCEFDAVGQDIWARMISPTRPGRDDSPSNRVHH